MAADGHIVIDTKINEDGFKAGSKDIVAAAKRTASSVGEIGEKAKISLEKQINAFEKQNTAYTEQEQKIESLKRKLEELGKQEIPSDAFEQLKKGLSELEKKYQEMSQKQKELLDLGVSADKAIGVLDDGKTVINYTEEMDKLAAEMDKIKQRQKEMKAAGTDIVDPTTTEEYINTLKKLNLEEEKLRLKQEQISTSYRSIGVNAVSYSDKAAEAIRKQEEAEIRAAARAEETSRKKEEAEARTAEREAARMEALNAKLEETKAKEAAAATESSRLREIADSADISNQHIVDLNTELTRLKERQIDLDSAGLGTGYEEYDQNIAKIAEIRAELDNYRSSLIETKDSVDDLGDSMSKAAPKASGLSSGIKKMVKYSLGIRSMYVLFRKLRSAIADGFKNLVQYSSETNSAISSVKSSLTQLKNSTAAAFAPLVNAVAPVISKFVNMISAAFTQLGKLIAALTGSNTFTKAVAVQEDYAASLKKTATNTKKAEKAAKSYLSPLDEINRYEEEASDVGDVSGGGYTAPDPSKMFETVDIDSKTKKLAENIKSYLQPIIDAFIRLKEPAMHLFTAIGNTALWLWNTILQPFADWFIQTVVPRLIDIFGKLMDIVAVVIDFINTTILPILEPVINAVLDMVIGAGNGILDVLDGVITFLHGIFTQNWSEAWDGIKMILSGFSGAAVSILNGVQNVFAWFDEWIQKIFVVDWTKAFGVLGVPLNALFSTIKNIWNAIKDVFNGVITFLKGVFTGNWKMAWEGVSQIFKGIWDGLVEIIKIPINAIILLINSFINFIGMGWNTVARSLNKLKVPDWVPVIGGKGISLPEIPTSPIPYLAKGAVIPPNAPFTAVLGDQKRGTNIETPESLLRQIMREELGRNSGGSGGSYTFIGQINRRTLFEEVISEATIRQTVTGKNPFELA
nr:MAG TPA: minor tail protein [Caudoviricetes sp.]